MKVKTLLLAGAAALAGTSAIAADLPSRKAAPVEYVKVCDVYGRGFFYIPGTDTCLKVGGIVRFEVAIQGADNAWRHRSLTGSTHSFVSRNGMDTLGWESRGYLNLDARTQSAWGTVQTVIIMRVNSPSGTLGGNYISNNYATGNSFSPTLQRAFIRFAGFTFGRGSSNFTTTPSFMLNTQYRGGYNNGLMQLAYTATFGGGFSATLALENTTDIGSAVRVNALRNPNGAGGNVTVAGAAGPSRLPALVGNLRVDQSWGALQLSGAVIQNRYIDSNSAQSQNITKTGWAVALGGRFNLPMLAQGSRFDWTVGYSNGLNEMIVGRGLNARTSSNGILMGGLQRVDYNNTIYDCSPLAGQQMCIDNTKAWNVNAILTHYWTPSIRSHLASSYVVVDPGRATRNTDWSNGGLTTGKAFGLAHNLVWSPVRDFDLALEVGYWRLRQGVPGLNGAVPSGVTVGAACPGGIAGCSPFAALFKVSPNQWNLRLRAERTF